MEKWSQEHPTFELLESLLDKICGLAERVAQLESQLNGSVYVPGEEAGVMREGFQQTVSYVETLVAES